MRSSYYKALAAIKTAIKRTVARIQEAETKTELIEEVMELRSQKRAELTCKHLLEND